MSEKGGSYLSVMTDRQAKSNAAIGQKKQERYFEVYFVRVQGG